MKNMIAKVIKYSPSTAPKSGIQLTDREIEQHLAQRALNFCRGECLDISTVMSYHESRIALAAPGLVTGVMM